MTVEATATNVVNASSPKETKQGHELGATAQMGDAQAEDNAARDSFALTLEQQRALQRATLNENAVARINGNGETINDNQMFDEGSLVEGAGKLQNLTADPLIESPMSLDETDQTAALAGQMILEPARIEQSQAGLLNLAVTNKHVADANAVATGAAHERPSAVLDGEHFELSSQEESLNAEAIAIEEGNAESLSATSMRNLEMDNEGFDAAVEVSDLTDEPEIDLALDVDSDPVATGRTATQTAASPGAPQPNTIVSAPTSNAGATMVNAALANPVDGLTSPDAVLAPNLKVETPLTSPEWGRSFADRVAWLSSQGQRSALIQITPEELGPVEVELNVQGTQASVNFSALQATTREAIEAAIPRLRESLAEAGLELVDVQTNMLSGDSSSFEQFANRDRDGALAGEIAYRSMADQRGIDVSEQAASGSRVTPQGLIDTFA